MLIKGIRLWWCVCGVRTRWELVKSFGLGCVSVVHAVKLASVVRVCWVSVQTEMS